MSNNEEKMRAESLIAVCRENGCTHRQAANIRDFVSQATASKQREIDALNEQLKARDEERDSLANMQDITIERLNRQVLELSAQVGKMREALEPFAENIPEDYKAPCHNGLTTARKCGRCGRAHRAYEAISLEPSTALRDYVNEEVAKALEEAADTFADNDTPADDMVAGGLRCMAAGWRDRE